MNKETMTREERVWAAVNLEKPDRVPVVPLMSTTAAARLVGIDPKEAYSSGRTQLETEIRAFDRYGGWDGFFPRPCTPAYTKLMMKVSDPARDDVMELQVHEAETMTIEDYDLIAEIGLYRFVVEHIAKRVNNIGPDEALQVVAEEFELMNRGIQMVNERGAVPLFGLWQAMPFFTLSLLRSMVKFTEDLYFRPEKVEKALKVIVPEWIEMNMDLCKRSGLKFVNLTEERAGAFFYPLNIFERFWMPDALEIVDAFWSEGIISWIHLDTCWDKNLPYLRQLPKKSSIIDLDGTTDIFAAKEILRSHLCIASDVHPTMLSLGTPTEVENYCRKVIDEVGADGGLILASGCSVPGAVNPECFAAMIETGKNYELSR